MDDKTNEDLEDKTKEELEYKNPLYKIFKKTPKPKQKKHVIFLTIVLVEVCIIVVLLIIKKLMPSHVNIEPLFKPFAVVVGITLLTLLVWGLTSL